MTDLHCHIIYGADDGPFTIKDSMKMILEADKIGVNKLITTPHYYKGRYTSDRITDNFNELKARILNFGIELFLGHEVFLFTALSDILSNKNYFTLNNSNYLLFELPFDFMPLNIDIVIQTLTSQNMIPIIAHPERSRYFSHDIIKFLNFMENGCLIQLDAASIIGVYGSAVKNFSKFLIKSNLVDFVGSDAHRPEHYSLWYKKAYQKVEKWAGIEYCTKIFITNQNKILASDN